MGGSWGANDGRRMGGTWEAHDGRHMGGTWEAHGRLTLSAAPSATANTHATEQDMIGCNSQVRRVVVVVLMSRQ